MQRLTTLAFIIKFKNELEGGEAGRTNNKLSQPYVILFQECRTRNFSRAVSDARRFEKNFKNREEKNEDILTVIYNLYENFVRPKNQDLNKFRS